MVYFDRMPNLPTYKGERDAATLSTWIDYVNRYAKLFGWNEQKKLDVATLFLRGNAYIWLMIFERYFTVAQPMTWNDFVEGLNNRFKPVYAGRQLSVAETP
ncbi:unnamed protein product [Cunninghamella echinulata]